MTIFGWLAFGIPLILVVWGLVVFGALALGLWVHKELRKW